MDLLPYFSDPMLKDVDNAVRQKVSGRALRSWASAPAPTARQQTAEQDAVAATVAEIQRARSPGVHHAFDMVERRDAYELTADVPGFAASDIQLTLEKDVLTVSGNREQQDKTDVFRVWRNERLLQNLQSCFTLPLGVNQEDISATLDKGVLTVVLPKLPDAMEPEAKRIQVRSTAGPASESSLNPSDD